MSMDDPGCKKNPLQDSVPQQQTNVRYRFRQGGRRDRDRGRICGAISIVLAALTAVGTVLLMIGNPHMRGEEGYTYVLSYSCCGGASSAIGLLLGIVAVSCGSRALGTLGIALNGLVLLGALLMGGCLVLTLS